MSNKFNLANEINNKFKNYRNDYDSDDSDYVSDVESIFEAPIITKPSSSNKVVKNNVIKKEAPIDYLGALAAKFDNFFREEGYGSDSEDTLENKNQRRQTMFDAQKKVEPKKIDPNRFANLNNLFGSRSQPPPLPPKATIRAKLERPEFFNLTYLPDLATCLALPLKPVDALMQYDAKMDKIIANICLSHTKRSKTARISIKSQLEDLIANNKKKNYGTSDLICQIIHKYYPKHYQVDFKSSRAYRFMLNAHSIDQRSAHQVTLAEYWLCKKYNTLGIKMLDEYVQSIGKLSEEQVKRDVKYLNKLMADWKSFIVFFLEQLKIALI